MEQSKAAAATVSWQPPLQWTQYLEMSACNTGDITTTKIHSRQVLSEVQDILGIRLDISRVLSSFLPTVSPASDYPAKSIISYSLGINHRQILKVI